MLFAGDYLSGDYYSDLMCLFLGDSLGEFCGEFFLVLIYKFLFLYILRILFYFYIA